MHIYEQWSFNLFLLCHGEKVFSELSWVVVDVVTFCLYHGPDKCTFLIGPGDLVNLVYTRGRLNRPVGAEESY